MNNKIRWTTREWEIVAPAYDAARLAGYNKRTAVARAMEVLPAERRRPLKGSSAVSLILKELRKVRRPPASTAPPETIEMPVLAPREVVASADEFDMLPASLRAVARKVADEIAHEIFQSLKGRLNALSVDFLKREALPRPRVLLVGSITPQQRLLEQEFGDLLDLRFVASNEPPRRVREIAPGCARVVLWTNYINHAHQEAASAALASRPEAKQLITGGMESLREALMKVACQ